MEEEKEWVSGEGWISDESSFHGDEEEHELLLSTCKRVEADEFWSHRKGDPNYIAMQARKKPPVVLYNVFQGTPSAWQLNEPVQDFLKRLPPVTSSPAQFVWIWVANPYPEGRHALKPTKSLDFVPRGTQLLEQARRDREKISQGNARKAESTLRKLLNQQAEALKQRIVDLAVDTEVLSGKWMLFPALDDVPRVWKLIVEGTINNRLGFAAKVATDEIDGDSRLICVYTKDFRDNEDVLRVLKELVSLGLVNSGKAIYYKCDAYTQLEIYGKNAYGLPASVYSSQKMHASAKFRKQSSAPGKKQSTLSFARQAPAQKPSQAMSKN
ncbi:DUF1917-domain-containing protein [Westerdykella ornata]|uniref:DUF1917-domain-containing protein n=1 Tax=Westerdykella ornata TaxID=318751 RepID=A0A6A6JBU3_WESOR|nr:DUF1917-domain-containing protein [Westerdykella ornata]KAF2273902.1 DUF1917-domain-containing protein [Westerdykella ornata]